MKRLKKFLLLLAGVSVAVCLSVGLFACNNTADSQTDASNNITENEDNNSSTSTTEDENNETSDGAAENKGEDPTDGSTENENDGTADDAADDSVEDVNGNTYVFERVNVSVSEGKDATAEQIAEMEEWIASYYYEGITISFVDGIATLTLGDYSEIYSYIQAGSTVTLTNCNDERANILTLTVSGSSLVLVETGDGLIVTSVYEKTSNDQKV